VKPLKPLKRGLLLGAFFAALLELPALDYGFTLHQTLQLSGGESGNLELLYTPGLGPWLSDSSREALDLYLSALVNMKYEYDQRTGEGGWRPVPELGRFSLSYRFPGGFSMEFGRIRYNDPNNLIVFGLFDGLAGTLNIGNSRLSLGAFYSGLLYRETARIFMTPGDSSWNYTAGDTVFSFAGRRLISALGWEAPSLFGSPHGLALNVLTQFDLNAAGESLNSQYLSFRFTFSPLAPIYARFGAVMGFAEHRAGGNTEGETALVLNTSLDWALPGKPEDALSFGLVWASGGIDDSSLGPFRSVTLLSPSNVLSAGMAGIAALRGSYTVRPRENLSLGLDCRYLFRGNLNTLDTLTLVNGRGKRALGGELYGSLIWVPLPDLSLVWEGGLFFPSLGNAVQGDTPPRWKTMLTLAFSF
jgi:hypothetical protein